MSDARFEDGGERPLLLIARDADDVPVLSALVQDAILPVTDMRLDRRRRRFAALINRFRWEDKAEAEAVARPYERVRSLLTIEDVQSVQSNGISRADPSQILSILSISFEPGEDGAGVLTILLAGDGAVRLQIEALEIRLEDVTRPYIAPSHRAPDHGV